VLVVGVAQSMELICWSKPLSRYNKMADKAANIAMDAGPSVQALAQDTQEELTTLYLVLTNDCEP
jgi:hypothetical protein